MPRTKSPAGTTVDRRNGRRAELEPGSGGLEWLVLPERVPAWSGVALDALAALRADPVAQILSPVDGPVIVRWLDALERAGRAMRRADRKPLVVGGNGQLAEHPSYGTAKAALAEVARCEAQLGVGPLNRARLGLTVNTARKSLADLNAAAAMAAAHADDDPRRD